MLDGPVAVAAVESVVVPNVLKAASLHTALSDATLFCAPASALMPALEAVRLEAGGGQLVAAATDRYMLGVSRVEYSGAAFTAMIEASDAKALAALAKTGKRAESSREVIVDVVDGGAVVTFRFSTGEELTVRGLDYEFPNWRKLLPATAERMGGIVGMGYRPSQLVKFTKVRAGEPDATLVVLPSLTRDGAPGPTVVQVGEGFIGLLMPARGVGDPWNYQPPGWLHTDTAADSGGAGQVR